MLRDLALWAAIIGSIAFGVWQGSWSGGAFMFFALAIVAWGFGCVDRVAEAMEAEAHEARVERDKFERSIEAARTGVLG